MKAIILYLTIATLSALAAYIIRSNNRWISNFLLLLSASFLIILFGSIIIEEVI